MTSMQFRKQARIIRQLKLENPRVASSRKAAGFLKTKSTTRELVNPKPNKQRQHEYRTQIHSRALFLLVPLLYLSNSLLRANGLAVSHEWETGDIRYPKVAFAPLSHALWRVADNSRCLGYGAVPQTSPLNISINN